MMGRETLQKQLNDEQESIELMVLAYQAKTILATINKSKVVEDPNLFIRTEFKNLLLTMDEGQAFPPERAEQIAQRYTPLAALDKDGAGAIIFRDNTDQKNIVAVRGTDLPANIQADLVGADGGIALSFLPMYQTSLIDNFIARETTPAGTLVPQVWFDSELGIIADEPQQATGRAVGSIKSMVAHSEGGPEAETMGQRYGVEVWTLNAPGVSDWSIRRYLDQVAEKTGISSVADMQSQTRHIHIDTTGMSIISQLHGGLQGEHVLMATDGASHGSVVALQVSRLQEKLLNENPKIQDRETLVALTKEYVLNPERGEQIMKVFNEHPGATPETATELVDLERGRRFVSMAGTPSGEQWYQNALQEMQKADVKAEKMQELQHINQREISRMQSQTNQMSHQERPFVRVQSDQVHTHAQERQQHKGNESHTPSVHHHSPSHRSKPATPSTVDLNDHSRYVSVDLYQSGGSQSGHSKNGHEKPAQPKDEQSLYERAIKKWSEINKDDSWNSDWMHSPHSDASRQMKPEMLSPRMASLYQQAGEKLGNQLNHLPKDERETAIAMVTYTAVKNMAREVDYVHINEYGQMLVSFDRDRGFDCSMNVNQIAQNQASDLLNKSADQQLSYDQERTQQASRDQSRVSEGMTMAHRMTPPSMG